MSKLKVEQFVAKIDELTPTENNPRQISKQDFENLKKSMKEFPEMREIRKVVVDENNRILGGHMRIKALKELGESEVPVDKVYGLTEKQKRRFVVQDNIQNGEWDMDELANSWSELPLDDWGIGVEWDTSEQEVVEDEVPEVDDNKPADSVEGGVYQLGRHRLMCGDSTDAGSVAILMNGQKADMVFTDPPYNMDYCGAGFINDTNRNVKSRIKNIIDFDPMGISYLSDMEVGSVYIFTSKDLIRSYLDIFKDWRFNLLIWEKTNTPPMVNNNFFSDIEYLLYFHRGKRIWNNGLTPIDIYKKFYISPMGQGKMDAGADLHPTMKPLKFISDKIKISSKENGAILDLFGGSGSTLIACEQLGRNCYMMELDPKYCDVIRKRYWKFKTGSEEGWQEGTKEAE